MLKMNITTKRLNILNITELELDNLLRMYNDFDTYSFATGINSEIKKWELVEKLAFYADLNNSFVAVAKRFDDIFIGCMKGFIDLKKSNVFWLSMLMIDKPFINQGYGTEFYYAIEKKMMQDHGINEIYISVSSVNNKAVSFWTKNGFNKDKEYLLNNTNLYSSNKIYIYLKCL